MRKDYDHSFIHGIQIATPCHESWDRMTGDERTRFCHSCKLNVYNLAEMTTAEIEALLREKEGRTCVRLFRRKDGKILTRDCPKGLAMVRRRMFTAAAAVLTFISAGVALVMKMVQPNTPSSDIGAIQKLQSLVDEAKGNATYYTSGDAAVAGGAMVAPEVGQRVVEPVPQGRIVGRFERLEAKRGK